MFMKGFGAIRSHRPRSAPLALLIALLLHTASAPLGFAQNKTLSGILDINFGSTMEEARSSILLQEGIQFDSIHSDADNLVYDGGVIAGQPVGFWILGFVDDQMHTGKAIIQPIRDHLMRSYHELVASFTATYGEPTLQAAHFDDPYEHGDGFETHAISFGKGHFSSLWKFSDGDNENAISISIDKNLYIPVVFQSGRLIDLAIQKQENATVSGL